jgi:hypothetical protein
MIEVLIVLCQDFTYKETSERINKKFKVKTTENSVRKAYERFVIPQINLDNKSKPKVLSLDIETSPMLGYIWGLWDNNVAINQLKTDWHILSWAAKWYDDPVDKVMYMDQRNAKNIEDDSKILKKLWTLLDEADIILTQYGKKFDKKKINARFILNGMKPPSSYRHIDTLQIAKKHFGFTSHKLEYMTDKLCTKFKKSKHAKYTGFLLWRECLNGNEDAWNEMQEYNTLDILSLEELYSKLAPWDNTINFNVYSDNENNTCNCGSTDFKKAGFYYTNSSKFQKYTCKACGSEYRDNKNLLSKSKKGSLKTRVSH